MSQNFTARRAPNVSQYLQGLNELPQPGQNNDFQFDDAFDLAHVDFLDLDAVSSFPPPPTFDQDNAAKNAQNYQFNDFQTFAHTNVNSPTSTMPSPSALHGNYPAQSFSHTPVTGEKRKASIAMPASAADLEDQSRLAAEEDKRRRNTAASARFRIKKKQREQALEKQTKEMGDKLSSLEAKVQQLEMENKWLKGLITEKSDVKTIDFAQMKKESEERSSENRTDGVGTANADAEVEVEA
ncbi:Putative basic-leucine zipper domain-containing protein [Septoria linicola]|uniref:Basic-leucine zipper domain-containing protein n=1 Tax=Septoria linicola TaxID=215465 RepID=A0A9Q9EQB7_9PEZI|nr:putative basic-leucine zipper domain-containing protein [Septoria linicola]USW58604.1 Putative basic-leucine zipper domain-containing protein [Septoria linicola]